MGQRQPQRLEEQAHINRERLGPQPRHAPKIDPVDRIRMDRIDFGRTRHVRGDDVDFLAAQPPVDLGRPYRSAAFGRQEQFGDHQQSSSSRPYPLSIESTLRTLRQPGFSTSEGKTARTAAPRCALARQRTAQVVACLLQSVAALPAAPVRERLRACRSRSSNVRTFSRCAATGSRRVALSP